MLDLLKEAEREEANASVQENRRRFMEREHGIKLPVRDERPAVDLLKRLHEEFRAEDSGNTCRD